MTHPNDPELIDRSLRGDRDAFGELVGRYQSLVCSVAYCATGSLAQSEDLAQETFVTAWQQLSRLREPAKLRSWLCGIARNVTNNSLRKAGREPVHHAEPIEAAAESPALEAAPADQAVSREEESLLWRSLERLPETYREPLILFYREGQSIDSVATALDLTEDAVKQRLSRGRKLLQDEMAAFVEKTLKRSAPGRAFTIGVLAALPSLAVSASAAGVSAAAAKGSAIAGSAATVAILNAALGPAIGIAGAYFGAKASINATRTPRERQYMIAQTKRMVVATLLLNVGIFFYIWLAARLWRDYPIPFVAAGIVFPLAYIIYIFKYAFDTNRTLFKIRAEEIKAHPEAYTPMERTGNFKEYRSQATLLGLPLIHVRSGCVPGELHRPAVGWIAVGDKAYGLLVAVGGFAVGGIAIGGAAVGLISLGGAALGGLALGGLSIGGIAIGGGAIGVIAVGGAAVGYTAALGGLAIAKHFAIGGAAFALHANDLAARQFFLAMGWLDLRQYAWLGKWAWLASLPALYVVWQARRRKPLDKR